MAPRALIVAEKPEVAEFVARSLSNGNYTAKPKEEEDEDLPDVFQDFTYVIGEEPWEIAVTSANGHLEKMILKNQ